MQTELEESEHFVVFSVEGPQPALDVCSETNSNNYCWNSLSAPSCWIELRHVHGRSRGDDGGSSQLPRFQNRHSHDTIYREAAVLQDDNTLGPMSAGSYELRLTECYGSLNGESLALVSCSRLAVLFLLPVCGA